MTKLTQAAITEMAAKLTEHVSAKGTAYKLPGEAFYKTAPQGVTEETVTAVDGHRSLFAAGATQAVGQMLVGEFKKPEGPTSGTLDAGLGKGWKMQVNFAKDKVMPDVNNPGETTTLPVGIDVAIESPFGAQEGDESAFQTVRNALARQMAKA